MKTNIRVKLTGTDGNVFSIIAKVSGTLKKEGEKELAAEFRAAAFSCGSYDEVLRLCMSYVEVE